MHGSSISDGLLAEDYTVTLTFTNDVSRDADVENITNKEIRLKLQKDRFLLPLGEHNSTIWVRFENVSNHTMKKPYA